MGFDFKNDIPIFLQIIEEIKLIIINGVYKKGEKIPSVRELAVFFEVNPNTVQKALVELEETGIILTESTNGKFVTNDNNVIEQIKSQMVREKIDEFFLSMQNLGIEKSEVIKIISEEWLWRF